MAMPKAPFERLRWARRKAGFRGSSEAAERFDWNKNTYKSHENGVRGIKPESAERYARAFSVSAAWLLTGERGESALSPEEERLIAKYRSLGKSDREVLELMLNLLDRPHTPSKQPRQGERRQRRVKTV